jgi:hypothetical protein
VPSILVFLLSAPLSAQQEEPWIKVVPADQHFSVSLPANPADRQVTLKSKLGSHAAQEFVVSSDRNGKAEYVIVITDRPLRNGKAAKPNDVLNALRDAWLAEAQGVTTEKSKKAQFNKYPGLDFKFQKDTGDKGHALIFVTEKTCYVLSVVSAKETPFAGQYQRFISSFKLI